MRSSDCRRGIHWRCTDAECDCGACSHSEFDTTEDEFDRMWDEATPASPVAPGKSMSDGDLTAGVAIGVIFL